MTESYFAGIEPIRFEGIESTNPLASRDYDKDRYAGWQSADARSILDGTMTLESISDGAVAKGIDPKPRSGRQEYAENLVSRYI